MKICSHIHTNHSHDSATKVEDIINKAINLDYDAIIVTDHNTTKGAYEALKLANDKIKVIIGAEFNTENGHIICINIDETIENECKKKGNQYDFQDLIRNVRKQNGLLFLAHPIQSRAKTNIEFIKDLDGIELINSRVESSFSIKESDELNKKIIRQLNPALLSGCDAHEFKELESTYMKFNISSLPENKSKINNLLLGEKTIYYKKSSYKLIAFNKLTHNKTNDFNFYVRQIIKVILGIFIDFKISLGGNKFETISICKGSKQEIKTKKKE